MVRADSHKLALLLIPLGVGAMVSARHAHTLTTDFTIEHLIKLSLPFCLLSFALFLVERHAKLKVLTGLVAALAVFLPGTLPAFLFHSIKSHEVFNTAIVASLLSSYTIGTYTVIMVCRTLSTKHTKP